MVKKGKENLTPSFQTGPDLQKDLNNGKGPTLDTFPLTPEKVTVHPTPSLHETKRFETEVN